MLAEDYKLYWGDMHSNIHSRHVEEIGAEKIVEGARKHLDFFPIAYYPRDFYEKNGLHIESITSDVRHIEGWRKIQKAIANSNEPGKFVTFLGYEWHGHGKKKTYGDHNIFFLKDFQSLERAQSLPELLEILKDLESKVMVVPHHTAYKPGRRGKIWDYYDQELMPVAEIYSSHGCSESEFSPFPMDSNADMGPRVSGGTIQDGLSKGYKFGFIASNDTHEGYSGVWGKGLVGVYAEDLTRESLWRAFQKRRVYGVTGDRIGLNFSINEGLMGSVIEYTDPLKIRTSIEGSDAVDYIELLRNNNVIATYSHSDKWNYPSSKRSDSSITAKFRIECGWGPTARRGLRAGKKSWKGRLCLSEGRVLSVEPCFTHFGQDITKQDEEEVEWKFTTWPRDKAYEQVTPPLTATWPSETGPGSYQSLIFEISSPVDSSISLSLNDFEDKFTIEDISQDSKLIGFEEETKRIIKSQVGLSEDEIENSDIFWHHAYKIKIYRAVPKEGYRVEWNYIETTPPKKENYYYVRVRQVNGQGAWSSPIWVSLK